MNALQEGINTERVEAVRSVTQSVVKQVGLRYWLKIIKEDRTPSELMTAMRDAGLLAVGLSEELGGAGRGIYEEAAVIEELGAGGMAQGFVIIPNLARRMVSRWGTPEQRDRFVQQSLRGEATTCFAITGGSKDYTTGRVNRS